MSDGSEPHDGNEEKEYEYDSWVLTEQSFHWLTDTNGQCLADVESVKFHVLI
jgi:hypothetical protein